MKRLTILRHAKSSWELPDRDDFDRPLDARGWKDARRMGRELRGRDVRFDYALASPAARVRETLDAIAETYGEFTFPVRFEPTVYHADLATLMALVACIPNDAEQALLVGHNPGLQNLVITLDEGDGKLQRRVSEKFPTAALAVLSLDAENWSDVVAGSGTLCDLIVPKALD